MSLFSSRSLRLRFAFLPESIRTGHLWMTLASVGFCVSSFAQNQMKVFSGDQAVEGAQVWIESLGGAGFTNAQGVYDPGTLPPGTYTVMVSMVGYETARFSIEVPASKAYEFELKSNSDLETVTITGTLNEVNVRDAAVKVEVLSSKRIELFMPPVSSSLVDAIQLINGVREVVACGVCGTNSISINGLPGPYTAILIDGMPIYGNLASVYGLNGIPASAIDRIEVTKGPNSTLYGSEALAGIVNIITKTPEKQPLLSTDALLTSHAELFTGMSTATRLGAANFLLSYNGLYADHFEDRDRDGFSDAPHIDRHSVFTKASFKGANQSPVHIAARFLWEDRRNGVKPFLDRRGYQQLRGDDSIYGESIYTRRWELFGSAVLWKAQNVKLDFSASRHDQDSYYGSDNYTAAQDILFVNLTRNRPLGNHRILTGLGYRYQAYNDNTPATQNPEGADRAEVQHIPAVFAEDEWTLGQKWQLLSGLRMDYYRLHGVILSPRVNVKYAADSESTVRLNVGTGFRIVNLFAEDHAFISGQRALEIEGDLSPERSVSGNLNFNRRYSLGSGYGSIDADLYYTHFFNKIAPDYSDPAKIVYGNSQGFARTSGFALNWSQSFAFPLSFTLGGLVQRAVIQEENTEGRLETQPLEFAPDWSSVATINYRISRWGLSLGYSANLTGPMKLPEVYDLDENGIPLAESRPLRSPITARHNIQIQWETKKSWTLYAGIQNLFDELQSVSPLTGYNDPNAAVGFSPYFDTSYAYATGHGREYFIGARCEIRSAKPSEKKRLERL